MGFMNIRNAWLFLACLRSRQQREEREHHAPEASQLSYSFGSSSAPGAALGYNLLAWCNQSYDRDTELDDDDFADDDFDSDW